MRGRWYTLHFSPVHVSAILAAIMVASIALTVFIGNHDVKRYTRERARWKTEVVDQLGFKTVYTYNGLNQLSQTDALGNTTTFTYDSSANRVKKTDPLGHTNTYSYDANGNLVDIGSKPPDAGSSNTLQKALRSLAVHRLLLGVERARLANTKTKDHDYQQRLDELRNKENTILAEYPTEEFSLDD